MTYNPDALFGKGRRVKRGETGTVEPLDTVSNGLRGNNGDDSSGLFE